MNLTEKRNLSAAIKKLHGSSWTHGLRPIYDKRGLPSVYLTRFSDLYSIQAISKFPVYSLQLDILKDANLEDLRIAIPMLVKALSPQLEFLQIDYVPDTTTRHRNRFRNILPPSGTMFSSMPALRSVVFSRINFGNAHMRAMCLSPQLTKVDIRDCDVSRSIVTSLEKCASLETFLLHRCKDIPPELETWFRRRLPQLEILRIR